MQKFFGASRIKQTAVAASLLVCMGLSGCVGIGEPYPYYGGGAPYYGTTVAPAYAYGEVGGGYYPYHRSQHIYSSYNTDYWKHQKAAARGQRGGQPAPQVRSGGGHPEGGHEGNERH